MTFERQDTPILIRKLISAVELVSAPIFYPEGKIAAGLGVVGPIQRMSTERIEKIKESVINYANEITNKLVNPANS